MISDRETYQSALMLTQLFESRVSQVANERAAELRRYVDVASKNQVFWYCSDANGLIQILQDAAFVCTGIHVIGQEITGLQFVISIENLWPSRQATQNAALPISLTSVANTNTPQSLSVSVDHFLPAYTQGNTLGLTPVNIDYWYTPVAEWLIERGDAVRCLFQNDASTVHPTVALSGYKVIG